MSKLLIASNNEGKIKEIKDLLADLEIKLLTPRQIGLDLVVDETGNTYSENAALKGLVFARESGLLTLADDSGLEVEALGGAPGLHSSRFSPRPGATDRDRRDLLLRRLQEHPRPWKARFRCVIALVTPDLQVYLAQGECPGEIITDERGDQGFGYDPIFLLPEKGLTMAELDLQEKNQVSHRARAVLNARPTLFTLLNRKGISGNHAL